MMRFLLLTFCLFVGYSFGQRYSFVEYSTSKGLPQSQVSSIAQDENGYLWVGTLGGLAKFNGKKFTSYTRDNGLAYNKITFLKNFNKELWIGHEGGVSVRKNGEFSRWYLPKDAKNIRVTGFSKYKKSVIIATNGDGLYRLFDQKLLAIPFPEEFSNKIRDITEVKGTYYLATRDGVCTTTDFKIFKIIANTELWSISDLELNSEKLLITTFNDGVFSFNTSTKKLTEFPINKELFPDGAYKDHKNNLWFNTSEGLLKYDNNGRQELIDGAKGLPLAQIECIFEDNEQNIWLGSSGKGLIFFPGDQFVYYDHNSGLPTDLVLNINQDKYKHFWVSTYNMGIVLKKNNSYKTVYDNVKTIWTSAMDVDGHNWFGTELGLVSFSGEQFVRKYAKEDGLLNDKITSLYRISKSKMYIGGKGGLFIYDSGKIKVIHDNEESLAKDIGTIRDIEFYENDLYLGTDKGLFRLNNGKIVPVQNFSLTTFCLVNDKKGQLWLGTEEGLYSLRKGKIENRNFATETASRFTNFLNCKDNKLYIGTNNGLYVSQLGSNGKIETIDHYGIQEGVVNLETNLNSGYIDNLGNLWFGTASGMVRYKTAKEKKLSPRPQLILQNILLNYQATPFTENDLNGNLSMPSSKNNISFEFDGISLSKPGEMYFQFWLEGVEEDWSPKNSIPTATFTGLRSGTYTLHARTVGEQGINSKEIKVKFTIRPPFYQTWWFIALCVLALAFLIYQFFQFRIRTERENNERETVVFKNKLMKLEQQSLNASMNRHFIFNSLNSIQYFINTQDKQSANKYLTNFAQLIRKNLDSSDSDGNFIPLTKELERLDLYMSLEAMRFKDRFTYKFENSVENADQILIPAMLLQPFVENSIVHGILPKKEIKGEIIVKAWTEENMLFIRITDNGIGISKSLKSKATFDGDHKSQGVEITAKRLSLIKEMSNKGFEIIGPEDIIDENRLINGTYVLLKIPFELLDNSD
jgi:ligand-binding sensor domain-containing protein/signal transduction histidine kinase